jgi:hypothetical protein
LADLLEDEVVDLLVLREEAMAAEIERRIYEDTLAMPEAERTAKNTEWTADMKKHWSVENGELVNDGKGAYLTTDGEYGDIELLGKLALQLQRRRGVAGRRAAWPAGSGGR